MIKRPEQQHVHDSGVSKNPQPKPNMKDATGGLLFDDLEFEDYEEKEHVILNMNNLIQIKKVIPATSPSGERIVIKTRKQR